MMNRRICDVVRNKFKRVAGIQKGQGQTQTSCAKYPSLPSHFRLEFVTLLILNYYPFI